MTTIETGVERRSITFFDGAILSEGELFDRVGISVDQREAQVEKTNAQRTHCTVGACAFTLVTFEATHPHIVLGND